MIRRLAAMCMTLVLGVVVALALVAAPAHDAGASDRPDDHDRARRAVQDGEIVPLRSILDVAAAQFAGEMVEAELDRRGPLWLYRITVLAPDGSILKLSYDGATARLVRARGHDVEQWYRGPPEDFPERGTVHRFMHERMHDRTRPPHWFHQWWRDRKKEREEQD